MRENLYFIAILPPPEISSGIISIQNDLSERFETKKALKVMPHITLKAPFKVGENQHENVLRWFTSMAVNVTPFIIELKDFGSFPNLKSPVIYIKPVRNLSLLALQKEILRQFQAAFPSQTVSNLELSFKPHMTVAYRDLHPDMFKKAWPEFSLKKYSVQFEVIDFQLLQHNGKEWNVVRTFNLSGSLF